MVENTLPYLNVLLQDFEQKMNHAETCFHHSYRILQELEASDDPEINEHIIEAKVFVSTGHEDIREIRDIYHELKKGKYHCQNCENDEMLKWVFCVN